MFKHLLPYVRHAQDIAKKSALNKSNIEFLKQVKHEVETTTDGKLAAGVVLTSVVLGCINKDGDTVAARERKEGFFYNNP